MLDTNNYVTVDGAVHHNSGKSVTCCMEVFRRCAEMPVGKDGLRRSRWVIVRNTRDQLKKTTLKTWLTWFPDGVAGRWKESEMTYHLEVGDIRGEIMFLPLDTPDDQRRLLSLEVTGVFINEAREVHPELIVAARTRMPRFPSKAMLPIDPKTGKPVEYWSGLIMDTNPPSEDSWLYEQFETKKPAGWELFRQPSGLDPAAENRENLGSTYYEDMMEGATEDFVRVHVHGNYGRSLIGRAVYEKTFDREYHVAKGELRHIDFDAYPVIVGMDFGRTPAAVFVQRGVQGQVMVLDSLFVENCGLEKFLREHVKPLMYARFPRARVIVVGDPAGWNRSELYEKNVADVLKDEKLACVKAPTNDPVKRIAAVERQLSVNVGGRPGFLVDPRCKHLIQGMYGGYKFRRKQDGSYDVQPMKDEFSHDNDALQYACLGLELGSLASAYGTRRRDVESVSLAAWT